MAAQLKLHYFNGRGRAELIRYILHYANADFEDYRIEQADWQKLKSTYPNLQVPVLEIIKDGKSHFLSQSMTISRHLAKRHNLAGSNPFEEARCDEIVDSLQEIHNVGASAWWETDAARKEKTLRRLKEEEIPRILGRLEKLLAFNGGEHLVGEGWTWADLHVATLYDGMLRRLGPEIEAFVKKEYPGLHALHKNVEAIPEIAAYLAKRPVTPF